MQLAVAFGMERESPKLGVNLRVPAAEENIAVLGEKCDCLPLKEDTSVVVAVWPYPHHPVVKAGHDVVGIKWQLGERNVARC